MSDTIRADVVVVGGGAAGLAAAVALARSQRSVVVIDAGQPRNAAAAEAHNILGQEGVAPTELLARGRTEATAYGARIVTGVATGASGTVDDFVIEVDDGRMHVSARRVILATGLVDDLPNVPGVEAAWGRTVLHCPFCHGWEVRGQRIAVLGRNENAIHQVILFRQLSDDVTLFLHEAPEPSDEQWEQLAALNVRVVTPRVERLLVDGTSVRAVAIEGGKTFEMDAVVVAPVFLARTELFEALGGAPAMTPFAQQIAVDSRGQTVVRGVWAAGNVSESSAMIVASATAGLMAGAAIHGDLAMSDLALAVKERRDPFSAAREAENCERILGDRRHGL